MERPENGMSSNDSWLAQRAAGMFFLLVSLGAGFYFIWRPLQAMLRQEPSVYYSNEGVLISFCVFFFGMVYTALGHDRVNRLMGQPTNLRITIVLVIVFGIIGGFYLLWEAIVRFFGYQ